MVRRGYNFFLAGCVYRTPEPDDVHKPLAIASTLDALRVWQVKAMMPQMIGLPVHVNHAVKTTLLQPVRCIFLVQYEIFAFNGL